MTTAQPYNPVCGYNYEAPHLGSDDNGNASTNAAPTPMALTLTATVSGLTVGKSYNLYQYRFTARPLRGALNVPTSSFNANAAKAFSKITFTATGATYQTNISITSDVTVTFRCVPTTAS